MAFYVNHDQIQSTAADTATEAAIARAAIPSLTDSTTYWTQRMQRQGYRKNFKYLRQHGSADLL